jgi:hypothetical protein
MVDLQRSIGGNGMRFAAGMQADPGNSNTDASTDPDRSQKFSAVAVGLEFYSSSIEADWTGPDSFNTHLAGTVPSS